MKNKIFKQIQKGLIALAIVIIFIPTALKFDFEYQTHLLIVLGFCFIFISTYSILNIEKSDLIDSEGFFPYKSSFIGVDYWFLFLMWIFFGVLKFSFEDSLTSTVALFITAFWVSDLIERIVKNKRKLYNLYFDEDRIIINEDRYNEILYDEISSIEMIDSKTFRIFLKNKKEKIILNVDRITGELRNEFIKRVQSLESRLY